MKFEEALPLLRQGESIRRTCWPGDVSLEKMTNNILIGEDSKVTWNPPMEALLADDWEVKQNYYNFSKVLDLLKTNKAPIKVRHLSMVTSGWVQIIECYSPRHGKVPELRWVTNNGGAHWPLTIKNEYLFEDTWYVVKDELETI